LIKHNLLNNNEKKSLPVFQPKFLGESISRQFIHSTSLGIIWTILPALILMVIAGPSFALLYSIDEVTTPTIIIRVVGHQWYWSYEYVSVPAAGARFDSYIMNEVDIPKGGLRLLEVNQRVVLSRRVYLRLLVSSGDVLYSWAIPSLYRL
jgi:cytochrome c oxidase subunit 2